MKAIKENWKLVLIVAAGIVAVIFMCIFGIQGAQNKAFALEEQVNTADSDIKVQEKRRVDFVYNLADCVTQYDKHEAETLTFKIYTEDFLVDPAKGDYDTVGIMYVITPSMDKVAINRYFKEAPNGFAEIDEAEYKERKEAAKARMEATDGSK